MEDEKIKERKEKEDKAIEKILNVLLATRQVPPPSP